MTTLYTAKPGILKTLQHRRTSDGVDFVVFNDTYDDIEHAIIESLMNTAKELVDRDLLAPVLLFGSRNPLTKEGRFVAVILTFKYPIDPETSRYSNGLVFLDYERVTRLSRRIKLLVDNISTRPDEDSAIASYLIIPGLAKSLPDFILPPILAKGWTTLH